MSETEFAMLIIGVGVFVVAMMLVQTLRRLHRWRLLVAAYCFLLVGWGATTLEALFQQSFLNMVEHAAYAAGAILAASWCWLGPHTLEESP